MNERPFDAATYTTHHMGMGFEISKRGELYMISQGAGAGYGDLLERDPNGVIKDIEDGLMSPGVAERLYKVKFDPQTLAVNHEATANARDDERKARLARGVPYADFVKTWSTPKPPKHLQYYGCWGDDVETLYMGSSDKTRPASSIKPNYMLHPKDVRIAELEAKLAELGAIGGEKQ